MTIWSRNLAVFGITATMMGVSAGCGSTQPAFATRTPSAAKEYPACPDDQDNTAVLECLEQGDNESPLVPPLVVGPGRIRLALRPYWAPEILAAENPRIDSTKDYVFVDVTPTGQRLVASGGCPDRTSELTMNLRSDGSTVFVCSERAPGEWWRVSPILRKHLIHYGVVNEGTASIEWRWQETVGAYDGEATVVDLGRVAVILYRAIRPRQGSKPCNPGPCPRAGEYRYKLVPGGESTPLCYPSDDPAAARHSDVPGQVCPSVVADFVDQDGLQIIALDSHGYHRTSYHHFTVSPDGALSGRPLQSASIDRSPGIGRSVDLSPDTRNRHTCLAAGQNGSVTLTLLQSPHLTSPVQKLTIRREQAWFPSGPQVLASDLRHCPADMDRFPGRVALGGDGQSILDAEWVRASYNNGWVIAYIVPGSDMYVHYPASIRIERHRQWPVQHPRP